MTDVSSNVNYRHMWQMSLAKVGTTQIDIPVCWWGASGRSRRSGPWNLDSTSHLPRRAQTSWCSWRLHGGKVEWRNIKNTSTSRHFILHWYYHYYIHGRRDKMRTNAQWTIWVNAFTTCKPSCEWLKNTVFSQCGIWSWGPEPWGPEHTNQQNAEW